MIWWGKWWGERRSRASRGQMAMGEVEGGEEAAFREESAAAIDDLADLDQQAGADLSGTGR